MKRPRDLDYSVFVCLITQDTCGHNWSITTICIMHYTIYITTIIHTTHPAILESLLTLERIYQMFT